MRGLLLIAVLVGPPGPDDPDLLHHFRVVESGNHGNHVALHFGLQVAAAGFDLAATQRCLDRGTCREGHPLFPGSRAPYVRKSATLVVTLGLALWADLEGHDGLAWWITGLAVAFQVALGARALSY